MSAVFHVFWTPHIHTICLIWLTLRCSQKCQILLNDIVLEHSQHSFIHCWRVLLDICKGCLKLLNVWIICYILRRGSWNIYLYEVFWYCNSIFAFEAFEEPITGLVLSWIIHIVKKVHNFCKTRRSRANWKLGTSLCISMFVLICHPIFFSKYRIMFCFQKLECDEVLNQLVEVLTRESQARDPRATCCPPDTFVQPTNISKIDNYMFFEQI